MNNYKKIIKLLISLAIIALLAIYGFHLEKIEKLEFDKLVTKISDYSFTTAQRVARAVVTLPEGDIIVGLKDGIGSYVSRSEEQGIVTLVDDKLKTNLINGTYKKTNPRLDALVPMYITADSLGGSVFVILFEDRGDAAIEKSYARLGSTKVQIKEINTMPSDSEIVGEEYKVSIIFTNGLTDKEIIIPVVDGHFDPKNSISK